VPVSEAGSPRNPLDPRTWSRPGLARLILAVIGVAFLAMGLQQAWADSPTFDEPPYIAAGLSSLTTHDLRINPEHPPLAKAVAALPVLLARPVIPRTAAWRRGDERVYSAEFVQANLRAGTLQRVVFLARLVPLLEALAAALLVYALARRLFGLAAGVTGACLWLAGPLVVGLGHLDGIDLPFTVSALLVALCLVRVLELDRADPGARRRLVLLGLACGVSATVKDTGLLLALLAPGLVLLSGWRSRRGWTFVDAAVVGALAWAVIWLVYLAIAPHSVTEIGLLPRPDLDGIRYLGSHDTLAGPAYLLGMSWTGARWWYWPASLVLKLPLITLAVLLVGPIGLGRVERGARRRALAALAIPAVALTVVTVPVPRDIGVRYLLPVLALWLVLASPIVLLLRGTIGRVVVAIVVVVALVSTGLSNPHSIAWTAPPFRPAYRVAADSNVDWGQDFYRLRDWSRQHRPYVAYFGPRGLGVDDVPGARPLLSTDPHRVEGWVAVSATLLTANDRSQLSWLRAYCPVGTIGGSIVLYRFDAPPDTARGPARPADLCAPDARFSSRPLAPG
jgi:4-amino-4-deoxy-L-arabinose transferase-like glycosyltransferase